MNDLWTALQKVSSPILLYGMGNGADKILSVCKKKGIEISGVFASDGFVRGNLYRGMPVLSFREAKERFGDFRVLLSFASSRPEVLETISLVAGERTLYVPDVPVAGENIFDKEFLDAHMQDFKRAREILEDDLSKDVFDTVISCKLYGELHFFARNLSTEEEDFNTILHPGDYRICGDFGAYSGDTAKDLARRCPLLQQILSVEPDAKTFLRLQKNTAGLPVLPIHAALWDREETLLFTSGGNRGSGVDAPGKKQTEVRGICGDRLFEKLHADYLKFDVEGAELRALQGLSGTILRDKPDLLISCYHRPEDLFLLPLYVKKHFPFYRLYLRRHRGVPAWDINLYATEKRDCARL